MLNRHLLLIPAFAVLLTADQALELQRQIQEAERGIDGSGVDETSAENVDQS